MNHSFQNNGGFYLVKILMATCVFILAPYPTAFADEKMWDNSGFEPEDLAIIFQLSKSEWEQVAGEMANDEGSNGWVKNSEEGIELIIVNSNRDTKLSFIAVYHDYPQPSKPFAMNVAIHFTSRSMLVKYKGNFADRAIQEFREALGPEFVVIGHHDSFPPTWDGVEMEIQPSIP